MSRILIRGGRVVDPGSQFDQPADVLIEEGLIREVGPSLPDEGATVVDATGLVVAPGLVDLHVHFRDPGYEWKEDIDSGSRSAAAGGFTTVVTMANTDPAVDDASVVRYILEKAVRAGMCRVLPAAAVTKGLAGEELAEMGELADAGAVAFSDDGRPVMKAEIMRLALEYASIFGLPVVSHCEDADLAAGGVMHRGRVSTLLGLRGIPREAEEVQVARDLILAQMTGGRLHVAHVSSAGSVDLIRKAKARGIRVTAEVTPHHLALTDEAVRQTAYDTNTKMNPPLRTEEDRLSLIQGLKDGTIDCIASDHAPHHVDDKEVEFDQAAFGVVGLETTLPVVLTHLVGAGHLTLMQALDCLTSRPARAFGLKAGTLVAGSPADLVLIDLEREMVVDPSTFLSKSRNTPFAGWKLKGAAVKTMLGGRCTFDDKKHEGPRMLGRPE